MRIEVKSKEFEKDVISIIKKHMNLSEEFEIECVSIDTRPGDKSYVDFTGVLSEPVSIYDKKEVKNHEKKRI